VARNGSPVAARPARISASRARRSGWIVGGLTNQVDECGPLQFADCLSDIVPWRHRGRRSWTYLWLRSPGCRAEALAQKTRIVSKPSM